MYLYFFLTLLGKNKNCTENKWCFPVCVVSILHNAVFFLSFGRNVTDVKQLHKHNLVVVTFESMFMLFPKIAKTPGI